VLTGPDGAQLLSLAVTPAHDIFLLQWGSGEHPEAAGVVVPWRMAPASPVTRGAGVQDVCGDPC
jgi:hypothetical protein